VCLDLEVRVAGDGQLGTGVLDISACTMRLLSPASDPAG
jgi:hypothetical protein